MADLFSRKAKFEEVIKDIEAVKFHALNFKLGMRYPLAKLCYQHSLSKQ